jgi:hypothetical protein
MISRTIVTVFATAIFALSFAGRSVAKEPVALATSVTGKVQPPIEAFSELQSDTKLQLDPNAEVEFVHYPSCQTILVKGGRLSFTTERFFLKGGLILSTKRAKCPKTVVLAGASQIGGLVLRGGLGGGDLRVGTNPTFVLVGKDTEAVEKISVSQDGKIIAEASNPGRAFDWPKDAPPLQRGQFYTVSVTVKGATEPKTFKVESMGSGAGALTLIRLD